jgi:hypothetical protein
MDGQQLRDLIGQKRPRYKTQYRALIESISNGAMYQTYMYAFIIGYKLGKQNFIQAKEQTNDFFVFSQWSPIAIRDYIVMLLLNKSEEFGFKWIELENAGGEAINTFVTEFIRQMEGYANAGFEYLQAKWDKENMKFRNPFVFVNFLKELK